MSSNIQYISDLLYRHSSGESLTDKEQADLDDWLNTSYENSNVLARLKDSATLEGDLKLWAAVHQEVEDAWIKFNEKLNQPRPARPVHRIHFLRRTWFKYAAAVVVAIGVGTVAYLWNTNNKADKTFAKDNPPLQTDVAPGGEKAVLTLADGSRIILDSAANGSVAQQGNAQVVKLSNGEIVYNVKGSSGNDVLWNMMSTPAGGQYQVTLPDGTKVWLNAASSITYPAAFVSNERHVKITGEVYFEVAKDKQKPFVIDVDGKSLVEVLGTGFNINAYENEANIKTTLLEGSVKVSQKEQQAVLKPGQQAAIQAEGSGSLKVINNADVDQVMAWKNGLFNFNGADLQTVMRQLERWYDIKVKYEGAVPAVVFTGEMDRKVNLSAVLGFFSEMGLKFRLEGKTLVVL